MANKAASTPKAADTWLLHVELLDTEPAVWRRVAVPADMTLDGVHLVLQMVMGWEDEHLHRFQIGDAMYGLDEEAREGDAWQKPLLAEGEYRLCDAVGRKKTFGYLYDFGDSWEHKVTVEKRNLPAGSYPQVAWCVEGAGACPPEDVGGVGGYYQMLEAFGDPGHPDHEELTEWLGKDFDPAVFELEEANDYLMQLEPLEAREVYQILKDTALGQRVMQLSEHQIDSDDDVQKAVEIDDWWIMLAFDAEGVIACVMCQAADGRTGSLEDWQRTDPVALLSAWEKQQIDRLFAAL